MDNTATKLALIAMKANENRRLRFTSLTHHLNVDYLTACFRELAYRKAPGIDGRTVESYMDDEIRVALLQITKAIKGKRYRPQPVKRVYIEKQGSTKRRPLGLPRQGCPAGLQEYPRGHIRTGLPRLLIRISA